MLIVCASGTTVSGSRPPASAAAVHHTMIDLRRTV